MTLLSAKLKKMALLSERYKKYITVGELQKCHYCREMIKITFLSQNYKNDIIVRELQK